MKQLYPECKLKLFGSFPSNTHLPNSDLDMVVTGATVDKRAVLLRLKAELLEQQWVLAVDEILTAYIPVIKAKSQ